MDQEGSGFWLPPDWLAEELRLNETTFHLFDFIEVYVLNYCVKSNGNRTKIAFAHRLRKRHEEEAYDITSGPISGCSLASYQCVADWFRPAKWQFSSTLKVDSCFLHLN